MKTARIYIMVSTEKQQTKRQKRIIEETKQKGIYIAGIYCEKASGVNINRPELNRLINDL